MSTRPHDIIIYGASGYVSLRMPVSIFLIEGDKRLTSFFLFFKLLRRDHLRVPRFQGSCQR